MKAVSAVVLGLTIGTGAAQANPDGTINLQVENDSFIATDRHYTNGLYASWTGAPQDKGELEAFAERLMLPGDGAWRQGLFFGQTIFTPDDIPAPVPPADDEPYAGFLFVGGRLYRDDGDALDKIEVTLGMVGPASLAGNVQKWWHAMGLFGGRKPRGWHYQLHDEPGLILNEQRIWRLHLSDGPLESEILPQATVSAGNVYTYAGAGARIRIGSGLAADWGPPRIAPSQTGSDFQAPDSFGWYLYAGVDGRAVARNLFLDGNSFEDSAHVGHNGLVGDVEAGAALLLPGVRFLASYATRSQEFPGQHGNDQTLTLTLSVAD